MDGAGKSGGRTDWTILLPALKAWERALNDGVVISFIFCSWLNKVYVLDYPCLLIILTTPPCTITSDNREYNVYTR